MKSSPIILWLASWYPTKLDPFPGDFIQRRARALALYVPVQVLHIIKDADGKITQNVTVDQTKTGLLTETIVYYKPFKTGISLIDKVISSLQFYRLGKKYINQIHLTKPPETPIIADVHVAMKAGVLALWMKRKWKTNYSVTEHWTGYYKAIMPPELQRSPAFWKITKKIFQQAVFFRPETENLGKLINKEFSKIQYRVIPNVVETSIFHTNKSFPKPDIFTFVHVSTLGFQKNVDGILSVVEKLVSTNICPPFRLRLVGPAPQNLVEKVEASDVLRSVISFSGPLRYELVVNELNAAHAMLMFSRYENLPCVILEALCCGLPVISTKVGGIDEHLNSLNGIMIESEDKTALEHAILTMINNQQKFDTEHISATAMAKYNYKTVGKMLLGNYKEFYPQYF